MRHFLSNRLVLLAMLVSVGIGALFARTLWTIRAEEWNHATKTGDNLARTIEQGLAWTLDSFDQSLQGAAREVAKPEVWALPPALRDRLVFDNSLRARGIGDVLVLNAAGQILLSSNSDANSRVNFADRDYFLAFQDGGHQGLFIGHPVKSRIQGHWILPLARAYHQPDGRFAGVVVGNLHLDYINVLLKSLDLGTQSGVNLFNTDGVVVTRFPYGDQDTGKSIAGTPNFERINKAIKGSFVGNATLDNVQRLYSFHRVGDYPLIVNVAQAVSSINKQWYGNIWTLGGFALWLMVACVMLAVLFERELARRQKVSAQLHTAERDVRSVLNNTRSMIGYWDAHLRNRLANWAYQDWFGLPPEKMTGMHISELLGPELYALNKPMLDRVLQGEPQRFERTITDMKGVVHHTITSYVPDAEGGEVKGFFVEVIDISDSKRIADELFEEKERARLTLQAIGDAVVCTDAQGRVTYLNPAAERLTGWPGPEAAGHNVDKVLNLRDPSDDAPRASALRTAIALSKGMEPVRAVVVHRSSGEHFHVNETASPMSDRHGALTGAVTVLHDITETVEITERMTHLAQYDALTDLPNRVLLFDRAQMAMAQARRNGNQLALMYLDMDGFKVVNDRLGHDAGDRLLVQFAQRLKAAVRETDTVCRQGGDEFLVLLPGLDNSHTACQVARKILSICDEAFTLSGEPVRIGLSGGIALYPEHGDTFDALARNADTAMYAAKRGGRMRFMLYQGIGIDPLDVLSSADV